MRVIIPNRGALEGREVVDATTERPKCYLFSGIPFALPPIGIRRWSKPQPLPFSFSYGPESNPGKFIKRSSPCPQPTQFGVQSTAEDCLQLNIWIPLGPAPSGGWPVFFYLHGGFLQFGSNHSDNPQYLLDETDVKCIVVSPNYRLGVFGFLASKEIKGDSQAANFGFWDQRLALEWTYDSIGCFGGNKENITVGGLSAGSYATFHQLAHDIGPNSKRQLIRRVIQWSNGCGVQPKKISEAQQQFDNLCFVLGIPQYLDATQKLELLRCKTADELVLATTNMKQKFIRPILDGDFISEDLFPSIYDGRFGQRMKELGIQTIIGDLTQEWQIYKMTYPPDSYNALVDRLSWDYPRHIVEAVCEQYRYGEHDWRETFGQLYSDLQIHSTMRGLLQCISASVPLEYINRYRIDWRTRSTDKRLPKEIGATHGTDLAIWWFGNGEALTDSEKVLVREWLQPVGAFLRGEATQWGTKSLKEVKLLTTDGRIEFREDEAWDSKLPLWQITKRVTELRNRTNPKL